MVVLLLLCIVRVILFPFSLLFSSLNKLIYSMLP